LYVTLHNRWRKKVLLQEQAQLSKPPIACFGMAAALLAGYDGKGMSSRAIFHGGWGSHGGEGGINAIAVNASKKQGVRPKEVSCCLVLDLEQVRYYVYVYVYPRYDVNDMSQYRKWKEGED
jgi:hypothetical protein